MEELIHAINQIDLDRAYPQGDIKHVLHALLGHIQNQEKRIDELERFIAGICHSRRTSLCQDGDYHRTQ